MTSLDPQNPTFFEFRKHDLQPVKNIESHVSFIKTPLLKQCVVSIVIPARDEAENLPVTLESFVNQVNFDNYKLDRRIFEIIILANNCLDNTAEVVREWQEKIPDLNLHLAEIKLSEENANVGFVRRLLMNEGFHRLRSNKFGNGIIATTDGDTKVANDWLANIISEIENGADAVGGRILICEKEFELMDEKARQYNLLDEEYRLLAAEIEDFYDHLPHDPLPRHHQNFNGNFAVSTDAFARAGGIPDVKFLEDVAFYNALCRIDAKFRHSPAVKVHTSARNSGRTALGLSTQLNEWRIMGKNGDVYLVESAQTIEKRFTARRELRELQLFNREQKLNCSAKIRELAVLLCISEAYVVNALENSETFGKLHEKIIEEQNFNGEWNRKNPLDNVENAIAELGCKLKKLRLAGKSRKKSA